MWLKLIQNHEYCCTMNIWQMIWEMVEGAFGSVQVVITIKFGKLGIRNLTD